MKISLRTVSFLLFSLFVITAGFGNLRATNDGLVWHGAAIGVPFLWEWFLLFFFCVLLLRVIRGAALALTHNKIIVFMVLLALFLPLFLNMFLFSRDLGTLFFGEGHARTLTWHVSLAAALVLFPLNKNELNKLALLILIVAALNSAYSTLWSIGIIERPEFWRAIRGGEYRASGFFEFPSRIGVLITLAIGLLLVMRIRIWVKLSLLVLFLYALFLSGSRTGYVGVSAVISSYLLLNPHFGIRLRLFGAIMTIGTFLTAIVLGAEKWTAWDQGRISSYLDAIQVFFENPFGVALGEWYQYSSFPSPHNSLLFYLSYGGIVSGIAAIGVFIAVSILAWGCTDRHQHHEQVPLCFGPVLVGFLIASLFEQVTLHASNMFYFIILFLGVIGIRESAIKGRKQYEYRVVSQ